MVQGGTDPDAAGPWSSGKPEQLCWVQGAQSLLCVSQTLTGSSAPPVPGAEVVLLACVSLWEQQPRSGLCCVFGKSFPTAQPLSRAFGSAAVKV